MTGSRLAMTAAVSAGLMVTPVAAERLQNGARFGDWTIACEAVAVNETVCELSQSLVAREGERFLTELLAFNDSETPVAYLVARVPLGVYFPAGFSMQPEGVEMALDFSWQSCGANLCEALLVLDSETLMVLGAAETAIAGYVPRSGAEPLVFRVGTAGLANGLAALAEALGVPGVEESAPPDVD